MQSVPSYSEELSGLEATLRSFLRESSGQLDSLFDKMITLAENPTPESLVAIVEIYIQMSRIIGSTSIIDQAYDNGELTADTLLQYKQSIDPTLRFILQAEQDDKQAKKNNASRLAQHNYDGMHKSILDETTLWLKQRLAKTSSSRSSFLVAIVESKPYANSVASLEQAGAAGKPGVTSLATALVLMLHSLRQAVSSKKTYSPVERTLSDPVASHYLAKFEVIAAEQQATGPISKLYANKLHDIDSILEWTRSYMQLQLATIFDSKPELSIKKSFLYDYSESANKTDQGIGDKAAVILGLFLISVQYNYLRSSAHNSEDTAYIMKKLVLLRRNKMFTQEFTTADIKFLIKHANTNYVTAAAENIYKLLPNLDKKTVKEIAAGFSGHDIALLINTFRRQSKIHEHGAVYGDLGLWVEHMIYLFNRKAESLGEDADVNSSFAVELSQFYYFRDSYGLTLASANYMFGDPNFIQSSSTLPAIQASRLYNSERYGFVPVFTLRQMLFKLNLPAELFAGIIASAYMKRDVFYSPHEMHMLDMACEHRPLKEELFLAISANNFSTVRTALTYDEMLLDATNESGLSPLKAAVMTNNVKMVKFIISKLITRNKQSGITAEIALPLKFAIANRKQDVAKFFAAKLGIGTSQLQERVAAVNKSLPEGSSAQSVVRRFSAEYFHNMLMLTGNFLCKLSGVSLLLWIAAVASNSAMFTTIFAFSTGIPLLVTCFMHCMIKSWSFISSKQAVSALPEAVTGSDPVENLAAKFKAKYSNNISVFVSDFLCKLSCISLLAWVVAVVSNSAMLATIFALSTFVPLFSVCLMHCCMNSLSFFSVVDSLAIKLGYGKFATHGQSSVSPEMAVSYEMNVMPAVHKAQDVGCDGVVKVDCTVKGV